APRVSQPRGHCARGRLGARALRAHDGLPDRSFAFRQGERDHGAVRAAALSVARGGRRSQPAARRPGRDRRDPVRRLKRELASATAKKLAKLGIHARADLVLHLPLRYEDETVLTPLGAAPPGQPVLVQARVMRAEVAFRPRRQLIVHAEGLVLRFFNFYPSQRKQFERAAEEKLFVRVFGEVRSGWFGAEVAHPRYKLVREDEALADALTPIYPTTAGLGQAALRSLVLDALADASLEDTLPAKIRERYRLADVAESIRLLHQPPPGADIAALVRRTH